MNLKTLYLLTKIVSKNNIILILTCSLHILFHSLIMTIMMYDLRLSINKY